MATKYDWIVFIPDHKGSTAKRLAVRPDHVKGVGPRIESGAWMMGGSTLEYPPLDGEEKAFNGSCLVAHAASKEEVIEEIKKDVFATSGVWNLERIVIYPLMTGFRMPLPDTTK